MERILTLWATVALLSLEQGNASEQDDKTKPIPPAPPILDHPMPEATAHKSGVFWCINPLDTFQKILLIGSMHNMRYDMWDPALLQDIKSSDVLITEIQVTMSHDPINMIHEFIDDYGIEYLKEEGMVADTVFEIDDYSKTIPWTDKWTIKYMAPNIATFLREGFAEKLGKELACIHPGFVLAGLQHINRMSSFRYGLDASTMHRFYLGKKPHFALETRRDRLAAADKTLRETISRNMDECIFGIAGETQRIFSSSNLTPSAVKKKMKESEAYNTFIKRLPQDLKTEDLGASINRNKAWVTNMKEILANTECRGKKIVMIVGAGHLRGSENFIDLLKNEGFQFKPYE